MKVFLAALLLISLRHSYAVTPADCDETGLVAAEVLDFVNKGRRDGYLFQLLRVTDAHLDKTESATVYYLVLDVKEMDCPVISRKHWNDCEPDASRRPSELVVGQCKVIATKYLKEPQILKVNDFNCTSSSVSAALANTIDSPVLTDFFEDTEPYRQQAHKALEKYKTENGEFTSFRVDQVERVARARGGERTKYYVDFSVRNCSRPWPRRHSNVFGFCRAEFSYDPEASDLENPKDLTVNCEVFKPEEHRNFSDGEHHLGHPFHEHHPNGHHPHGPQDHPSQDQPPHGPPPHGPPPHGHPPHGPPPHGHPPHGPPPHGHPPHGPPPHGHPPHGPPPHGHHPHGPPPHGHPPHGHPPHGHHPHGHHPHGHHPHGHHPHGHHPHGGNFHDHGPCDPPSHNQDSHDPHHDDLPPRHSRKRGPGKGPFPFHWRPIGHVYRLLPLSKGEVLPPPEANFPRHSWPNQHNPLKPEIQPFPQLASESCPGKFNDEFSQLLQFFENKIPKQNPISSKEKE